MEIFRCNEYLKAARVKCLVNVLSYILSHFILLKVSLQWL